MNSKINRGDTLVEVLFATAVFSLVAVSCLSIMNQGAATAQRALEITLVRNEIDAQAEALRFMNASYISAYPDTSSGPAHQWQLMQGDISDDEVSSFGASGTSCPTIPNESFILNARKALYLKPVGMDAPISAVSFSQVKYNISDILTSAEGIWIQAVRPNIAIGQGQDNADYIDFHIRACWDSPGQSTPVTLGTIVRLYEPH
jgi:type II secretory pathway pseudopilin PulG